MKRIHVNKHKVASNRKYGRNEPVFTVKVLGQTIRCRSVEIRGESKLVYRPEKPLSCGAVAWVETKSQLILNDVVDADNVKPRNDAWLGFTMSVSYVEV